MLLWTCLAILALLVAIVIYDVTQKKHAILRNFPIIGHFRYILEAIGPELRQYIVTNNNEERPFSRDQRTWVYASSKGQINSFGFGTDNELEQSPNYLVIKQSAFPLPDPHPGDPEYDPSAPLPAAKVLGGARGRAKAFRPASAVYVSGMSYGSLSGSAVKAMNLGAASAGCLHNTGEGGVSKHHLHGGDLIWQVGTGYFGCRDANGRFDRARFLDTVAAHPQIKAVEFKLSQGAKPGLGGLLPGAKVTPEIAAARGIPVGKDCASPSHHTAFSCPDSLLDFVEDLADETGLPIGIKSAVGDMGFWDELARLVATSSRSVDYIQVDGGEGGTGAAPLVFSDHVSMPFKIGFSRVFKAFAERGIHEQIMFVGSGKLGFPENSLCAFALGADMIAVAREPMLAIGCIQAQRCQTGHCPTGVATHNPWLERGLVPEQKGERMARYIVTLRKELNRLARACGVAHPGLVTSEHLEILDGAFGARKLTDVFGYPESISLPGAEDRAFLESLAPPRAVPRD